jgi:3-oxoacyl-[acyl-carrier protein] reductase
MNLNLQGRRAIVCGSTQGIGRASAEELSALGASITLIARNEEKLKDVLKQLSTSGSQKHDYIVADFQFPEQLRQKIEQYVSGNDIHILVNNTGGPAAGPAIEAALSDFVIAFSAHLLCNQVLVQAVVPSMKKENFGRIINIISTSVKMPIKGLGVSNTIRGAVANWAKTLSVELGPFGITVNNVLPGASKTARLESIIETRASKTGKPQAEIIHEIENEIPAGRISTPYDIAAAVAFLATPAAGYINGINVPVDGGRTGTL